MIAGYRTAPSKWESLASPLALDWAHMPFHEVWVRQAKASSRASRGPQPYEVKSQVMQWLGPRTRHHLREASAMPDTAVRVMGFHYKALEEDERTDIKSGVKILQGSRASNTSHTLPPARRLWLVHPSCQAMVRGPETIVHDDA